MNFQAYCVGAVHNALPRWIHTFISVN